MRRLNAPRSAAGTMEFNSSSTLTASLRRAGGRRSVNPSRALESQDVRVDGQAGQAEGDAAHDVASLAPHPGDRDQIRKVFWYVAVESLRHRGGHTDQALGLGSEEAGRAHELLDVLGVGRRQVRRLWVGGEQRRGHHVHADVRGLRRQDGGRQQLEGVLEVESTQLLGRPGIELRQTRRGEPGPAARCPGLRHRLNVPGYFGRRGRRGADRARRRAPRRPRRARWRGPRRPTGTLPCPNHSASR